MSRLRDRRPQRVPLALRGHARSRHRPGRRRRLRSPRGRRARRDLSSLRLPHCVAELSHAAPAAGTRRDPARERGHLGPAVGGHNWEADGAQTLGVVDVVSDVSRLYEWNSQLAGALTDECQLVVDSLDTVHAQLLCARSDDGIALHGDDQHLDSNVFEPAQAKAVAAGERERFLPALVDPHAVVGEHPVEIEHREAHPLEQRRELRHGCVAACAPACSERGSTSSNVTKPSKGIGRLRRLPMSRSSSYGGSPPSAGDLIAMSSAVRTWPSSSSRAATSFFPIFSSGSLSTGSGRLTGSPSAAGIRCTSRTSLRIPSGMREKAWSRPLRAWSSV